MTLLKWDPNHDVEWQITKDFTDADGTMTAAIKDYIKEQGMLQELLDWSDTNDSEWENGPGIILR